MLGGEAVAVGALGCALVLELSLGPPSCLEERVGTAEPLRDAETRGAAGTRMRASRIEMKGKMPKYCAGADDGGWGLRGGLGCNSAAIGA